MQVIESADYFEVSSSDEEYVTEAATKTEKVHYSNSEIMEVLRDVPINGEIPDGEATFY